MFTDADLADLRTLAEEAMRDTCVITKMVEGASGGEIVTTPTQIYSGKCRVYSPSGAAPRTAVIGGAEQAQTDVYMNIPYNAVTIPAGAIATVTAWLDGSVKTYRVEGELPRTTTASRRLRLVKAG